VSVAAEQLSEEQREVVALVRQFTEEQILPVASQLEHDDQFPDGIVEGLKELGIFGFTIPEEYGGLGLDLTTYALAVCELSRAWMSVSGIINTHFIAADMLMRDGTDEQRQRFLPDLLGGELLGAYALSEPQAGSDVSSIAARAVRDGADYVINGTKAWISHGPHADFWLLFARTGPDPRGGLSAFHVPAGTPGVGFGAPEKKMGMTASTTTQVIFEDARIPVEYLIGAEGQGMQIALSALDSGRLGIAACATGLAQAALDAAVGYAKERQAFGQRIIDHQGLGFVLADMQAAVTSSRATYLDAARRKDLGLPYATQASVAKLVATDAAMKVTTDAVQVLGGYGYTRDFPVERYMREAKVMQIFEGTNQIQRMVIARSLDRTSGGALHRTH
jgi:alkylation response protein AidB-like acyl-CoA dehydrogenase